MFIEIWMGMGKVKAIICFAFIVVISAASKIIS